MPNARIQYGKIGDIWERGRALLAWKLGSKGLVVDVVVVPSNVGGGSVGVYQRIRGGETINIIETITTEIMTREYVKLGGELTQCYTLRTKREFNRMFCRLWVITGQTIRRGKVLCLVC